MTAQSDHPRVVLVGVAGAGKSRVGRLLAAALAVPFVDADDLHPAANRERMARGEALDDESRRPWLALVRASIETLVHEQRGFVLACSLLKRCYRDDLARHLPPFSWVHLAADPETLRRRLEARRDHFFPPSLLRDQLDTWQPLEIGLTLAAGPCPEDLVASIRAWLRNEANPQPFTQT